MNLFTKQSLTDMEKKSYVTKRKHRGRDKSGAGINTHTAVYNTDNQDHTV